MPEDFELCPGYSDDPYGQQDELVQDYDDLIKENHVLSELLGFVHQALNDTATHARKHPSERGQYLYPFSVTLMADINKKRQELEGER